MLARTAVHLLLKIATVGVGLLPLSEACAQRTSAGVVVGRSLTGGFQDLIQHSLRPPLEPDGPGELVSLRAWSRSRDFLVGGTLEVRLNPHWSLEANALFRELHGQVGLLRWPDKSPTGGTTPHQIVTWQFPVLAKYRFHGRKINPFVAVGPSFRTVGNVDGRGPSHHGIAAGAGFEMNWRSLKIAPAVRYTLWAWDKHFDLAQSAPDQLELLVGFSRASEEDWRPLGRHVSLGFTFGVNVTGDYPTTRTVYERPSYPELSYVAIFSGARSLMYGPTVEVRLPHRFSVEAGALHRPIGWTEEVVFAGGTRRWTARNVTWVFPVLAKYRFPVRGPAPFIALGPSFRMRQYFKWRTSPYGLAAAVGLEMRAGPMKIAPAIRYTHWAADTLPLPGGPRRSQSEALVGFSF